MWYYDDGSPKLPKGWVFLLFWDSKLWEEFLRVAVVVSLAGIRRDLYWID